MSDEEPVGHAIHSTEHTVQRLRDPLSEPTRSARRALLTASTIGVIMVEAGLVPSNIDTLGFDFGKVDQPTLFVILGLIILYFLGTFILYGFADVTAWFMDRQKARLDHQREMFGKGNAGISTSDIDKDEVRDVAEVFLAFYRANEFGQRVAWARAAVDVGIPLLIGLISLSLIAGRIF